MCQARHWTELLAWIILFHSQNEPFLWLLLLPHFTHVKTEAQVSGFTQGHTEYLSEPHLCLSHHKKPFFKEKKNPRTHIKL